MLYLKVDDDLAISMPSDDEGVEDSYAVIMENYDHIYPWSHWLTPEFTLEDAREFRRGNIERFKNGGDAFTCRIVYRGEPAGSVNFHNIDRRNKSAEIGYWLAKKHTGRGLASAAVKRFVEYAFTEMELNRVVLKIITENAKSIALAERIGFTREGVERQGALLHNKFVDQAVYSMLAEEWRQKYLR